MHRKLLLLTRDTRLPLLLTILTALVAGLLTIGQSYVLSATVDYVFLQGRALSDVSPWMAALLAFVASRALLGWINEVAANRVAVRIKTDLRQRLFDHILALGPAYTRGERTGELTAAAVEGIEALDAYFSEYLPQLVISALVPAMILLLVFPLDPLSGVVLLLTAPLIPFFMYMIGQGAEAVTRRQYDTLSRLSAHFLDSLQGITTLKLFGQAKAQARNIAAVSDQYRDMTLKVLQVTFLSALALELLATISTAIIAVEVGLRLLYGQMQFREALFLLILAPEFYLPLRMLGLRFHAGMAGTSAARRIFQILDIPLRSVNIGPRAGIAAGPDVASSDSLAQIELSEVSYTYPDVTEPALNDVSMTIKRGQHVALVGPSGAGKTTLASILLRFMDPMAGIIRFNGKPVGQTPVEEWRGLIAWVPQSPHLFHDTIAANIRIGKPDASDHEVRDAARAARLQEFIESLPDKYETQIGEGGARLSSGQAQRLALARAFIKDAPILIMDEPTSSLDPETEALLEESARDLMRGRTVITIAHRLNTAAAADLIIVMQAGRIVETGTHRALLRSDGIYAGMVNAQTVRSGAWGAQGDSSSRRDALTQTHRAVTTSSKARLRVEAEAVNRKPYSVLRRLLSFLRGSWGWVALSVGLGTLTIGSGIALMGASSWLISMAALHPSIAALEVAIVGVRFFGIARAVFRYLERLVSHNVTFRLLGRLRVWFYEKLEPLAPARLMEYRAGDLLARVIGDVNTLENFYVRVLAPPAVAILVCAGASLFLGASDARLAALLVSSFVLIGAALPWVVHRLSQQPGAEAVAQRAHLQAQLVDGIQGLPDLLAFGREADRLDRLRLAGNEYGNSQRRLAWISGLQTAAYTLITNLTLWLVLWIVIPQVTAGQIPGLMLAPLVLIAAASFEAVTPLPQAAQSWTGASSAARRLFDVVDGQPEVEESLHEGGEASHTAPSATPVEIRGLSFSYPGQSIPTLQDIHLSLHPGRKVALVGPTGAGKSTLASLMLRFWDYECGDIYLDGRSIKDYTPDAIRDRIALVSPNTYFFNTSVYENLRMARRRVSREDVEKAARAAQIHDTIVKLTAGYDTLIGEQGLRLSGGERQRLAVARAILKDAPILILDEPTANLDTVNEAQILAMLFELMKRKSSLLITHRLIGLENMDEILVLEHGRIVERGTEKDLLQTGGTYRRLWELQNRFLPEH